MAANRDDEGALGVGSTAVLLHGTEPHPAAIKNSAGGRRHQNKLCIGVICEAFSAQTGTGAAHRRKNWFVARGVSGAAGAARPMHAIQQKGAAKGEAAAAAGVGSWAGLLAKQGGKGEGWGRDKGRRMEGPAKKGKGRQGKYTPWGKARAWCEARSARTAHAQQALHASARPTRALLVSERSSCC